MSETERAADRNCRRNTKSIHLMFQSTSYEKDDTLSLIYKKKIYNKNLY